MPPGTELENPRWKWEKTEASEVYSGLVKTCDWVAMQVWWNYSNSIYTICRRRLDGTTWVRGMLPQILWSKKHAILQEIKLETAIKSAWTFAYGVAWLQEPGKKLKLAAHPGEFWASHQCWLLIEERLGNLRSMYRARNHPLVLRYAIGWKIIGIVGSKPGWDWQDHSDFTSLHISFRWWRGRSPGKKVMYPNMYIFIVCFMIWTPQQKIVYKGIKYHKIMYCFIFLIYAVSWFLDFDEWVAKCPFINISHVCFTFQTISTTSLSCSWKGEKLPESHKAYADV